MNAGSESLLPHGEDVRRRNQRSRLSCIWGPENAVDPSLTLWPRKVQEWPYHVHRKLPSWFQKSCLIATLILCFFTNVLISSKGYYSAAIIDGNDDVDVLKCGMEKQVWKGPDTHCGLNASDCIGAHEKEPIYRFKCPADCLRESWTYQPMPVGDQIAMRESFVVGGDNLYRADSFPCAAALHRGLLSNKRGGCAVIKFKGSQRSFPAEEGQYGLKSLQFDTEFPESYTFEETSTLEHCYDFRYLQMTLNFLFILAFGYFVESPLLFLLIEVTIGFWTVFLASNPVLSGGNPEKNAEVVSMGFRRFLPCILGALSIYYVACKRALGSGGKMRAYLTRSLLWGGAFYCGICENYVFGAIPIDRLTVSDLNSQAGAWTALIIILVCVLVIAVGQAYVIWRMGKFWPYLLSYLAAIASLTILACWPNETLRIHHYILALFLLPGTNFQTTPSLVYNGILVGLYVAGVSRWGFDSILQTSTQLARGGPLGGSSVPTFLDPVINGTVGDIVQNYTLQWKGLAESNISTHFDGFSLIINDVERYRGPDTSFNLIDWVLGSFADPVPTKFYVRLAFAALDDLHSTGAFTRAATVFLNGNWTMPLPGTT